jgi:hypothetical protein
VITLTAQMAAVLALVGGGWIAVAAWATARGLSARRSASLSLSGAARREQLLAASPLISMIVAPDGSLDGSERLSKLLGQTAPLQTIADLCSPGLGFAEDEAKALAEGVRSCARSGSEFSAVLHQNGSGRSFLVRGSRRRQRSKPAPFCCGLPIIRTRRSVAAASSPRSRASPTP